MKYSKIREEVCRANKLIAERRLACLTWGNVSGCLRDEDIVFIKPSGVPYEDLRPADMVPVQLSTGAVLDSEWRPSSDLATHLHLYRSFRSTGGIVHTHSTMATAWAQAEREIPCLGTTHADHFYGAVPLCRALTEDEVSGEYELNTGRVIEEFFLQSGQNPSEAPGVLVARHGPFAWGSNPMEALENAIALEEIAAMALHTLALHPAQTSVPPFLLDRHYLRKHGHNAYYGQKPKA